MFLTSGGLVSHGYLLRRTQGSNNWHRGATYDVLDLTGKVVMTIPYHTYYDATYPARSPTNSVQLIDGYAVVAHADAQAASSPSPTQSRFRFTIYDLDQGGKKVADAPESVQLVSQNVDVGPHALASCGGKLILTWATGSMLERLGRSYVRVAVLDIRTGQTTPPIAIEAPLRAAPAMLNSLADPTCSTALLYGHIPGPTTFAISLARGTLLWQRDFLDQYLSMHDGAVYAVRAQNQSTPTPSRLESIAAASGTMQSGNLTAPLAFTVPCPTFRPRVRSPYGLVRHENPDQPRRSVPVTQANAGNRIMHHTTQ